MLHALLTLPQTPHNSPHTRSTSVAQWTRAKMASAPQAVEQEMTERQNLHPSEATLACLPVAWSMFGRAATHYTCECRWYGIYCFVFIYMNRRLVDRRWPGSSVVISSVQTLVSCNPRNELILVCPDKRVRDLSCLDLLIIPCYAETLQDMVWANITSVRWFNSDQIQLTPGWTGFTMII